MSSDNKQEYYQSLYDKAKSSPRLSNDFAITYIDTAKVNEIVKDLAKYADEYTEKINKLFNRFKDVTSITEEWFGNKAELYFRAISMDRAKFISFGNNLKNIVGKLDIEVNLVSSNITKLNRLESEARYSDQI